MSDSSPSSSSQSPTASPCGYTVSTLPRLDSTPSNSNSLVRLLTTGYMSQNPLPSVEYLGGAVGGNTTPPTTHYHLRAPPLTPPPMMMRQDQLSDILQDAIRLLEDDDFFDEDYEDPEGDFDHEVPQYIDMMGMLQQ